MISEHFLDICFSLILGKTPENIIISKSTYKSIISILRFYKKLNQDQIPVFIENKFYSLISACRLKSKGLPTNIIIDQLLTINKFSELVGFFTEKSLETLSEDTVNEYLNYITLKIKLITILKNYNKLSSFIMNLERNQFNSIHEIIEDYEQTIKSLYLSLIEFRKNSDLQTVSRLNILNDRYDSIISQIKNNYQTIKSLPTGFQTLDDNILRGGFEPSRLYIFGGPSGSGKSTLLLNFLCNAILKCKLRKKIFLYITLENLIDESFVRFYCCLFNKNISNSLNDIMNLDEFEIKKEIKNKLKDNDILMYYFPSFSISPVDIMSLMDEIIAEYGKDSIAGVYIDYLDLLKSETQRDLYRLELGSITSSLKVIAVHYGIPVITATQLNRDSYKSDEKKMDVNLVSESIKKVEHSDFVALLSPHISDETGNIFVYLKIVKNRSGKKGLLKLSTDFSRYRIHDTNLPKIETNKDIFSYFDDTNDLDVDNLLTKNMIKIPSPKELNDESKKISFF